MSTIAIITARGGSKRIPRKNIKDFCGKPILAYSIEAALESKIFDHVMVSTDDYEIAEIAKKYGAEVPFMRSAETASDYATTYDVLAEVIDCYEKMGVTVENFACIYPCAPFVTAQKLIEGKRLLLEKNASRICPIVRFSFPPQRCYVVDEDGRISFKFPEYFNHRTQDLEPFFHDCGQFYWMDTKKYIASKGKLGDDSYYMEIDELEVQDIDNETDWQLAEIKYKLMLERNKSSK